MWPEETSTKTVTKTILDKLRLAVSYISDVEGAQCNETTKEILWFSMIAITQANYLLLLIQIATNNPD